MFVSDQNDSLNEIIHDPINIEEQDHDIEFSKEVIEGRTSQVERILLDRGKNSFSIMVGSGKTAQKMYINLTNSFDGLALPSKEISNKKNTFYTP